MPKPVWSEEPSEIHRVESGFQLTEVDPATTPAIDASKRTGTAMLLKQSRILGEMQGKLFANSTVGGTGSLLIVLQGMDTSGKGGIVTHALAGMNPSGVSVHGFKVPTAEELRHGFLWRVRKRLPEPGMVGVFDRSHYEDVLAARVRHLTDPDTIEGRYGKINAFEQYAIDNGTSIVKVMLQISEEEQKRRLVARLHRSSKLWKYNPSDVDDRERWRSLQEAYQIALERTSTSQAPWHVIPADHKWYARLAVQQIILMKLRELKLHWPRPDYDLEKERRRVAGA
ncbi:PPK2 family polyphosphate:nucleotide phosphotransferase [Cryobacterium sp. CAN_C3]|uniref:PPK2 family polyphosphate kinase n=1 Tax=unclassified Cryobacterium TaxID=2649013 RepID=UPI0018CBE7FD|nr:PPK2 family polyphosphate kinase [Cryobacterium sp. CAN_C3]MEC5155381.1 PPK2 family polyphosphate:nucleotide phosphotransferase [Cryobacterium sp. CAN_C3]